MKTPFIKDVLLQAAELGALSVRFTGGEPLLRKDFDELYLYARRLGIKVILFTNARLITPERAALWGRIPPGKPVEVSVYGMHAESYDAVAARPGAFDEFQWGVDLLKQHRIPFIVKMALLPANRHEMNLFEAWAATLTGNTSRPNYAMNFELRSRRDHPSRNRMIASLRLSPDDTVRMQARDPGFLKDMSDFCRKFMAPQGDVLFDCGAGTNVCIDAYGRAQMCLGLRHPDVVCDLKGDAKALRQVLTDVFPRWRLLKAKNKVYLQRCTRCFLKSLCEQCPAKSWSEHGTLDTPGDYFCKVAHATARYLGLLREGERAWLVSDWQDRVSRFTAGATACERINKD